jgi:membrane-associated phospholipid phosphatase
MVLFFLLSGIVKTLNINERNERIIPLFITMALYYLSYISMNQVFHQLDISIHAAIKAFILAATIAIGITTIITFFWKISLHMVGVGGLLGLLVALMLRYHVFNQTSLIIAIVLFGLVGFARLWLKAHTNAQTYIGYLIGFLTVSITMLVY